MKKNNKILAAAAGGLVVLLFLGRKPIKRAAMKFLTDQDKKAFIAKVWPTIQSIGNAIGVPPLFILAQVALESRYGASALTTEANNFGGIKATPGQPYAEFNTIEYINGRKVSVRAKFAKFPSVAAGLQAQAKIYSNRYFDKYRNKTKDPIKYATLLQSGSPKYATAPDYVQKINNALIDIKRLLT